MNQVFLFHIDLYYWQFCGFTLQIQYLVNPSSWFILNVAWVGGSYLLRTIQNPIYGKEGHINLEKSRNFISEDHILNYLESHINLSLLGGVTQKNLAHTSGGAMTLKKAFSSLFSRINLEVKQKLKADLNKMSHVKIRKPLLIKVLYMERNFV